MKKLKTDNFLPSLPQSWKKRDGVFMALRFLLAFFTMSHPDLWETANHSYVFLEGLFSGHFLDFYSYCARHNNTYYYINPANYNIVIYIIFGLRELPVFIFNKIFGLALNETFLIYYAKAVSCGFYLAGAVQLTRLCRNLGLSEENSRAAAFLFIFNPAAFFSPAVMGQYDSICLFFVLWALVRYSKGDLKKFSLVMGAGVVCKFFPLLIFFPLLLLAEKKILNILKYTLMCLWLYLPTTLLFWGKTGNASAFTGAMIDRVLAIGADTPFGVMSVYLCAFAALLFVCYTACPGEKSVKYLTVYIPMAVFSLLMAVTVWHPQWVILAVPFMTATTLLQKNKTPWYLLDLVFCRGFFMIVFAFFGGACGSGLFSGGILGHIFKISFTSLPAYRPIVRFIELVPYAFEIMPVLFTAPVILSVILKFPLRGQSLADRISKAERFDKISPRTACAGIFAIGFLGMWLAPVTLEIVNAMGII